MKKLQKIRLRMQEFIADERGEFGIKSIAMIVAVIVIIGFAIGIIQGNLGTWISQVWDMFIEQIEDLMA